MGWGEDTKASDRSRIQSLEQHQADLEEQVSVLVVIVIGLLTIVQANVNPLDMQRVAALLNVLAPDPETKVRN